jgi:copper(I)-binding protein
VQWLFILAIIFPLFIMNTAKNTGKTVTLLAASINILSRIGIYIHSMENGIMHMSKLNSIANSANEHSISHPSGLHFMLFDVKRPLQSKQAINLTLCFFASKPVSLPQSVYNPQQEKAAQYNDATPSNKPHHH